MVQKTTSLGLSERLECALAYAFIWVSGLILFFTEKNRNVRTHALQSMIVFGSLSLLMFGVTMLRNLLGWIPLLNLLTNFGLNLLLDILGWTMGLAWVGLILLAFFQPDYHLPFLRKWVRFIV